MKTKRRKLAGFLALLGLALAPSGCRAQPTRPVLLSEQAVVLELPLVEQDELYECGLVSISALCQYYGVAIPERQRLELVKLAAERKGLSGDELRAALEALGFEVFLFEGSADREPTGLYHHVDLGRPLIVMTAERGSNHYVLLIGYDEPLDSLVLLDPRRGRVVQPAPAFRRLWEAASRFTLLAVPAAGEAPTDPAQAGETR